MADQKTQATIVNPLDFLNTVEPARRREDGLKLNQIFQEVTGWSPKMWGPTIVGFGEYHYVYDSGREGDSMATGFSPRKTNLSIYILPGYQDYADMLAKLGKHKISKSCLYINKLADIDENVLRKIIELGLTDLSKLYQVKPS